MVIHEVFNDIPGYIYTRGYNYYPTDPLFLHGVSLTADGTAPAIQNILHSDAEEIRAQGLYPSANFGLHVVITLEVFCITVVWLSTKLGSKMARASQSMTRNVFPIYHLPIPVA